jgi:uncharacterized protein
MDARAAELIRTLKLEPHPEGGFYRETFRSAEVVTPGDRRSARAGLTVIWFLLPAGSLSRWHRVRSAESWHYHEGAPLELLMMAPAAGDAIQRIRLGPVAAGQLPLATVPGGWWQAARPTGAFTLVSCAVGPGFDFADFEMLADTPADAARLRARLPEVAPLL